MPDPYADLKTSLPPDLHALIADDAWQEVWIGWTATRVFRLASPHGARYLKIAEPPADLTPEKQRLDWLRGRLPVPQVLHFADDLAAARQYLLLTALPGLPSFDDYFQDRRAHVIAQVAAGLRQIHATPLDDCPFDSQVAALIKRARVRVFEGRVDADRFAAPYQGRPPHSLLDEVIATRPAEEDFVFAHGDYCLPNVLIDPEHAALTGFVDWGDAGIADRYLDLALCARSITYNFGAAWVAPFWAAYGVGEIDHAKVTFFQLLDELF